MKFKIGDRVIYTSGDHGDYDDNPLWGGTQGNIVGTVREIDDHWYAVDWDSGTDNYYEDDDIEYHVKPITIKLDEDLFEI